MNVVTGHVNRICGAAIIRYTCVQITRRFSLAPGQAVPGDIIFPLYLYFKLARDVGNEPVQESDSEEYEVLEEDDEAKSHGQDEEILAIEIVRLGRLKVLLISENKDKYFICFYSTSIS